MKEIFKQKYHEEKEKFIKKATETFQQQKEEYDSEISSLT